MKGFVQIIMYLFPVTKVYNLFSKRILSSSLIVKETLEDFKTYAMVISLGYTPELCDKHF